MASKANSHYDWMKLTTGGKRLSAYSKTKTKPKKPKVSRGNIGEVIRERATRAKKY